MLRRFTAAVFFLAFIQIAALSAKESLCLKNGFCMNVDSHLQHGQTMTFKTGNGSMELPLDQVSDIVLLPDDPRPAAPTPNKPISAAIDADELLERAAINAGLEPEFVRSVARIESGFRQNAVSGKGAVGLMQLMPGRAALLGVDATIAEENALGGAKFLRELLFRYQGNPALALAAYNAGPGAVDKFKGVPPYLETRKYVIKVLKEYIRLQKLQPKENSLGTEIAAK